MLQWLRLRFQNPKIDEPVHFYEVGVPSEFRYQVLRCFKPSHGRYRLLLETGGKVAIFPRQRLSKADNLAIDALLAQIREGVE